MPRLLFLHLLQLLSHRIVGFDKHRENRVLERRVSTSSAQGFTCILNILGQLFLCFLGRKCSHKSVKCSTFLLCSKNDKNILLDLQGSRADRCQSAALKLHEKRGADHRCPSHRVPAAERRGTARAHLPLR